MDLIYSWINELSSFHQSILGAAVFSVSSWFVQKAYKKAKSSGSAFMEAYSELDIHKHVLHKEYVRSGNIQYASFGASIALLLAARWVMLGNARYLNYGVLLWHQFNSSRQLALCRRILVHVQLHAGS